MNEGEQPTNLPPEDVLPDLDGDYELLSVLSRSGRRSCFSGLDVASGERVFVKMLAESDTPNPMAVDRFLEEPAILSILRDQLGSNGIVPVLRIASWRGLPYFVQPLMPGGALSSAMRTGAAFNVAQTLAVLEQCLQLLGQIHTAGFVHGDVSPENILVITDEAIRTDGTLPEGFRICLVDFESAQRLPHGPSRRPQAVIAKPRYLAPEVAAGRRLTPVSDLFALGVILHELLVGRRPFSVRSMSDLRRLSADAVKPIPPVYEIPVQVEDLVRDLIAPRPEDRLQTAAVALERLRLLRELASCLGCSGPRGVNRILGQGANEQASEYVSLFNLISSELMISPVRTIHISSDSLVLGMVPRRESLSRQKISSYLVVRLADQEGGAHLANFSVFAPPETAAGLSFVLDLWVYPPEEREEVQVRAARDGRKSEVGSKGGQVVPLSVLLTATLKLDGFTIENPVESFYWSGHSTNVSFVVTVPSDHPPGGRTGAVEVLHRGILVARLLFEVVVASRDGPPCTAAARQSIQKTRMIGSAFASYSSQDRSEVLRRVQGIAAAGVDVFIDVLSIRSGQQWEKELLRSIREREIFYLFWSGNAARSKYVEREWRFALSERGLDFIHPVPLVNPEFAPPPSELSELHFQDLYLLCMDAGGEAVV